MKKETIYSIVDNKGRFLSYDSEDDYFYSGLSVTDAVSLITIKHAERMVERLNTNYDDGDNLAIDDTEYPVRAVEIELNYKVKVVD